MITEEGLSKVFKRRLAVLVSQSGKTQKENAEGIGILEQNLSHLLGPKNNRLPRADTLMRISIYYNVSVDWLLGRAEAKKPTAEQIHRKLGLEEAAIRTLTKLNDPFSMNELDAINFLLTRKPGYRILRHIASYLFADFSQGYLPGSNEPIREIEFRHETEGSGETMVYTFSAQDMAESILLELSSQLRWTRSAIHDPKSTPPYRSHGAKMRKHLRLEMEADPNVNSEDSE